MKIDFNADNIYEVEAVTDALVKLYNNLLSKFGKDPIKKMYVFDSKLDVDLTTPIN